MHRSIRLTIALLAALPAGVAAQQAQQLSIEEALRLAESQSEAVRIAQAGVLRARGQQVQARSQFQPQVGASLTYTRTLASQFEALAGSGPPAPPPGTPPVPPDDGTTFYSPCTRYLAAAGATQPERITSLEVFARCSAGTGGFPIDFSKVGFGSENQYQLGIQGSLDLYSGGRVQAQVRAAEAGRSAADIELVSQRARLALDITEAYFDAVLADRLVAIAESSLAQTESVLGQTRLARQVGNQSEFDLLRAQVTRDNQMPALLQRRTDRDLAHARLKQMLNVPGPDRLTLTTSLAAESDLLQASRQVVGAGPGGAQDDTISVGRAPVRQVAQALRAEQEQLRIAKSAWIPTVSLSTQYGRVAFPSSGLPDLGNFLTNWTVSLTASVPLFTGGRTRGQSMVAEAAVREAEARYEQVREAASLDAQHALALLNQAQAALAASQGTTEQAAKAYTIADVRYREGLSTQVELNDSRLLLQQASANAALAVRNLHVARMRVSLLRDLPLGVGAITIPLSIGGPALSPAPRQMAPQAGNAGAPGGLVRTSAAAAVVPPLP
jgi:outer membrane protein TolC